MTSKTYISPGATEPHDSMSSEDEIAKAARLQAENKAAALAEAKNESRRQITVNDLLLYIDRNEGLITESIKESHADSSAGGEAANEAIESVGAKAIKELAEKKEALKNAEKLSIQVKKALDRFTDFVEKCSGNVTPKIYDRLIKERDDFIKEYQEVFDDSERPLNEALIDLEELSIRARNNKESYKKFSKWQSDYKKYLKRLESADTTRVDTAESPDNKQWLEAKKAFDEEVGVLVDNFDILDRNISDLKDSVSDEVYSTLTQTKTELKDKAKVIIENIGASSDLEAIKKATAEIKEIPTIILDELRNIWNNETRWKDEFKKAQAVVQSPEATDPADSTTGPEAPDSLPVAEMPAAGSDGTLNPESASSEHPKEEEKGPLRAIKEIYNEAKLRSKIKKEHKKMGQEAIAAEAKKQAEFVVIDKVGEVVQKNLREMLGRAESADINKELATLLISEVDATTRSDIYMLADRIALETGLESSQVQAIISQSRDAISTRATKEVNTGVERKNTGSKLLDVSESKITKCTKIAGYVGLGFAAAGSGGLAAGGIVALRMVDRLITDKIKGNAVEKKADEIKKLIESDPNEQQQVIEAFFTDLAASKQRQIHDITGRGKTKKFGWNSFLNKNEDLLEGYEEGEKADVRRALNAIEDIDQKNNDREQSWFDRLKKVDKFNFGKIVGGIGKWADKLIIKGGESNSEKMVSVAAFGAAAYVARNTYLKYPLRGVAGWKLGELAANKLLKETPIERREISNLQTAQDILATQRAINDQIMEDEGWKGWHNKKNKRLAIKTATTIAAMAAPYLIEDYLNGRNPAETGIPDASAASIEAPAEVAPIAPVAAVIEHSPAPVDSFTNAVEAMKGVHGKDSHHLWGLIEAKLGAMNKNLEQLHDFSGSEGKMTNAIDTIKREIMKDPEHYGFPKGTDINIVTAKMLEDASQNDNLNNLIAEAYKPDSIVEHASNLSPGAVKHIEDNNDFYNETVQKLPDNIKLGQHEYDVMSQLHEKGVNSDEAARIISGEHLSSSTVNTPVESVTPVSVTSPATETGGSIASPAPENIDVDRAATAGMAPDNLPVETAGILRAENFQDEVTREKWSEVYKSIENSVNKSMENRDRNQVSKSLEAIFQRTGLKDTYNAYGYPYFNIERISMKNGVLNFEVPSPSPDNEVIGNLKFSYNPGSKELSTGIGNTMEKIKDIKNIDDAIKTSFKKVADQLRWR